MWRYLIGAGALAAAIGAGALVLGNRGTTESVLPAQPLAQVAGAAPGAAAPLPDTAPEATDRTREQKRFDRYDKDRNGAVTRDEYLAQRRKAYAKLDADHDGRLSFDEWSVKAQTKFAGADRDRSGAMDRPEFASTAVKRKPARRANCAPASARPSAPPEEES